MKKMIVFLALMFGFTTVYAAKINHIIFFGDSLTDNGNLYKMSLHIIPKSPPYFNGRFSNGPTWADLVSQYYLDKENITSTNYAVGGATAIFHPPTPKYISPSTLEVEVNKYLADALFADKAKSLFVIWIGDNDYMFDENADAATVTTKVMEKVEWAITTLINNGAKNFLILNLADASRTPMVQKEGSPAKIHAMVTLHNQKLNDLLKKLNTLNPTINLSSMNVYDLFNDFMDYPEKYNRKYHINITDTNTSCWTGGYWLKNRSPLSINADIQQSLRYTPNGSAAIDPQVLTQLLVGSPELAYTYNMTQAYAAGVVPCANPNEHMFWDAIHPTAVIHMLLAQVVIDALNVQMDG